MVCSDRLADGGHSDRVTHFPWHYRHVSRTRNQPGGFDGDRLEHRAAHLAGRIVDACPAEFSFSRVNYHEPAVAAIGQQHYYVIAFFVSVEDERIVCRSDRVVNISWAV